MQLIKNNIFLKLLLIMFIFNIMGNTNSFAQNTASKQQNTSVEIDKSKPEVEPVPAQKIEAFKKSREFQYTEDLKKGFDFWSYLWYWFSKIVEAIFSDKGPAPYLRILVVLAVLTFVVYKIFGSGVSLSLNKKSKAANGFGYFDEDIHSQDLDKKLSKASTDQQFREAIHPLLDQRRILRRCHARRHGPRPSHRLVLWRAPPPAPHPGYARRLHLRRPDCPAPGPARQMRFGLLAGINVAGVIVSVATGITTGLAGAGVWALVYMQLAGSAFNAAAVLEPRPLETRPAPPQPRRPRYAPLRRKPDPDSTSSTTSPETSTMSLSERCGGGGLRVDPHRRIETQQPSTIRCPTASIGPNDASAGPTAASSA